MQTKACIYDSLWWIGSFMEVDELPSEVEANYVQTWLQQIFWWV